jgi:hypothetical protein
MTNLSTDQVIADMRGWTDLKAYFEGARGDIVQRLNTATQRVGDTFRTYFVDQANGNDGNDGSQASPFKTLQAAASRAVYGGRLRIELLSDYHMDKILYLRDGAVEIVGRDVKRRITFAGSVDGADAYYPRFSRPYSAGSILFGNLTLVLSKADDSVVYKHIIAAHGFTAVTFLSSDFEIAADADVSVFQYSHAIGWIVQSVTYPAEINGKWVEGIPAGTDPKTLSRIAFTNLATL